MVEEEDKSQSPRDFSVLSKPEKEGVMRNIGNLLVKHGLTEVRVESTFQEFVTFLKGKVGEQEYLITEGVLPMSKQSNVESFEEEWSAWCQAFDPSSVMVFLSNAYKVGDKLEENKDETILLISKNAPPLTEEVKITIQKAKPMRIISMNQELIEGLEYDQQGTLYKQVGSRSPFFILRTDKEGVITIAHGTQLKNLEANLIEMLEKGYISSDNQPIFHSEEELDQVRERVMEVSSSICKDEKVLEMVEEASRAKLILVKDTFFDPIKIEFRWQLRIAKSVGAKSKVYPDLLKVVNEAFKEFEDVAVVEERFSEIQEYELIRAETCSKCSNIPSKYSVESKTFLCSECPFSQETIYLEFDDKSDLSRLVQLNFNSHVYQSGDKQTLIQCNVCQTIDKGEKFKCAFCVDFDLCSTCHESLALKEEKETGHSYLTHPYYRIPETIGMKIIK